MPRHKRTLQVAIPFGSDSKLYHDAMRLIEQANHYIHGEGRQMMHAMSPELARFYSTQAMQLSTRLMQTASLLLMIRAVMEGDMDIQDMERERAKIMADICLPDIKNPLWAQLPEEFHAIHKKSLSLAWQANHARLKPDGYDNDDFHPSDNAVEQYINRLKTAFSDKG